MVVFLTRTGSYFMLGFIFRMAIEMLLKQQ